MFCENCGNKIDDGGKFCSGCGYEISYSKIEIKYIPKSEDRWWVRLLKVTYIFLYIPLLLVIPIVWSVNSSSYEGYYFGQYQYKNTYGQAFWYCILAIIIYLIIARLIKIATLYIVIGQKPIWKKEFKKLF